MITWLGSTIVGHNLVPQESILMGWVTAMAAGLAVGLGLSVIGLQALSDPAHAILYEEKEARLRTFWAFFLMDR